MFLNQLDEANSLVRIPHIPPHLDVPGAHLSEVVIFMVNFKI